MKIVVLFGEDNLSSYKRFTHIIDEIRKRGWEHIQVKSDGKLGEQLVSTSLFGGDRLLSLHDAHKVPPKEYEWLSKHISEYDGRLLLYFPNTIPVTIKKFLPKDSTFEEFKLKKELFTFLEAVYPGNMKRSITLFHEILKTDAAELVLALLGRQVRDLAWVKNGARNFKSPPWRIQKLQRQAQKFSDEQLHQFISLLSEADVKSKTGQGDLTTLMDLILVKCL